MNNNSTIFSKLLQFIPRRQFDRITDKYSGDKWGKGFRCWDQFVGMVFGQLSGSQSLRELISQFNSNHPYFYHLGTRDLRRSTLSDANHKRNSDIFEDVFRYLFNKCRNQLTTQDAKEMISIIDASEMSLPQKLFDELPGHNKKAVMKMHLVYELDQHIPSDIHFTNGRVNEIVAAKEQITLKPDNIYVFDRGYYDFQWWADIDATGSIFVTRLKKNSPTNDRRKNSKPQDASILSDTLVRLSKRLKGSRTNPYQKDLREVVVKDDHGNTLRLITNDLTSPAEKISRLYKDRWQIELFFKWIKQNLKIKKFYGHSANAIKIQVLTAMIAYLLNKLLLSTCQSVLNLPLKQIVAVCKGQLFSTRSLFDVLAPPPKKRKPRLEIPKPQLAWDL